MHERVLQEIEMLRTRHPELSHGEELNWVMLELLLPKDRFNKVRSKALFVVPPGYPNTGPDNFFAEADLRMKDGSMPPAFNLGGSPPVSGSWGFFSWHPNGWRPSAALEGGDNLAGFVRSMQMCLRGEQVE
jgi:hypothetical protein